MFSRRNRLANSFMPSGLAGLARYQAACHKILVLSEMVANREAVVGVNARKLSFRKVGLPPPLVMLRNAETLTRESCLGTLKDEFIDLIEEKTWQ